MTGAWAWLRGLLFFNESAGATLTKKGGGTSLVLGGTSTTLGESNVASGVSSAVAGGEQNQALGQSSTVGGGDSNTASGYGAVVPGGSENFAEGGYSVAVGGGAHARHRGEFAQSNGALGQAGKILSVGFQTTDATPTQATLNGASAMIVPTDNEVWGFRARIVAKAPAVSKALVTDLEFAVTNFGGTLTQLGTTDTGFDKKTGSTTWTAAVHVSGDNVSVTVTGAVGETVTWFVDFWYTKL